MIFDDKLVLFSSVSHATYQNFNMNYKRYLLLSLTFFLQMGSAHATSEFDLLVDQPVPAVFQKGPFKDLSIDMKVWCTKSKDSDGLRLAELKFSQSINGPTMFEINRSRKGFDYSRWSWVETDYFASGKYATFSHYKGVYRRRNNPIARELVMSLVETGVAIWFAEREDFVVRGTLRVINKDDIGGCLLDDAEWGATDEGEQFRAAGDPARAKKTLSAIAGVYKPKVIYEIIGENPEVVNENILEVVPISDVAAYVKIRTWFVNAHRCEYEGVFEFKKDNKFIAVSRETESDGPCVLKMEVTDKKITFSPVDELGGSCSYYCSMRAGLYGTEFPRSKKRKIRYMDRLKNSHEYGREMGRYKHRFNRD